MALGHVREPVAAVRLGRRGRPGWVAFTVKLTDGCVWGWPVLGRHRPGGAPGERLSVRELLAWPYLAAIGLLMWLYRSWPRRVPNLARLTRTGEFGQLQSASAAWLERNFELVQRGAPWLERAGCWVCDRCHTSWDTGLPWLQFPRPAPWVGCGREVTVVYGFDGTLPGRLAGLAVALATAGWGEDGYGGAWVPLRDLARPQRSKYLPEPPVWPCRWSPVGGLALPPGLELESIHSYRADRGWLDMGLGWASRGEQAELVTSRAGEIPATGGCPPAGAGPGPWAGRTTCGPPVPSTGRWRSAARASTSSRPGRWHGISTRPPSGSRSITTRT